MLDFTKAGPAAAPRAASTVIVARDGDAGLEVFCVRRSLKSGFMGGALVFPGGKVDAADGLEAWSVQATEPHPRSSLFAVDAAEARAFAVAACRETLEEGSIVPVAGATLADDDVVRMSSELRGGANFLDLLGLRDLRLRVDALVPFARWVTPTAEPRRFDARFYLLELPRGQRGHHDQHETTSSLWASPAEILNRSAHGEFFLAPPTSRTLELLEHAHDVQAAIALAAQQTLRPICPEYFPAERDEAAYIALPGDPSHSVRQAYVAGPSRYVLGEDGRFVARDPRP